MTMPYKRRRSAEHSSTFVCTSSFFLLISFWFEARAVKESGFASFKKPSLLLVHPSPLPLGSLERFRKHRKTYFSGARFLGSCNFHFFQLVDSFLRRSIQRPAERGARSSAGSSASAIACALSRSRRAAAGRAQLLAKKGGIWAHAASAGTGTDP